MKQAHAARNAQRALVAHALDARLAEHMAEHGATVTEAASALDLTHEQARHAWRRIKRSLGAQAI